MTLVIAAHVSGKTEKDFFSDYQSLGYRLDEEAIREGALILLADYNDAMPDSVATRVYTASEVHGLPAGIEFCVNLVMRGDEWDAVIGDLFERYNIKRRQFGNVRANLYVYSELLRSLAFFMKYLFSKL